jgi:hypothetical protein
LEYLSLRKLFAEYQKTNKGYRKEVFYNGHNNNLIVFYPCDISCDTISICNSISEEVYDYLIHTLNTNKGVTVLWSQVEGTTSDYTIFYDLNPSKLKNIGVNAILRKLNEQPNNISRKYVQVKNGVAEPITRETMSSVSL